MKDWNYQRKEELLGGFVSLKVRRRTFTNLVNEGQLGKRGKFQDQFAKYGMQVILGIITDGRYKLG